MKKIDTAHTSLVELLGKIVCDSKSQNQRCQFLAGRVWGLTETYDIKSKRPQ